MKKRLFLILFIFISTFIFSQTGILWNSGTLKTVQTKWFDIIYPEDSKKSAKLLYKNADKIYEEIAASYGMEPSCRMPIVLTPEVEVFNAYWSNGYYNHIVLYDTASDESLEVFSEDLLSTFRHEVTHAFTYNMKNGFWKVIGNIFGDPISLVGVLTTSGWAEGATLTSESANGEGRLNNDYAKQIVRQAKIEGIFPSYADVQGARDIYPVGSYYYFNGAFDLWLQQNYGMEKYAQMWYNLVNPKTLFISRAFKNVYGIKLDDAWTKFYNDYEIPENVKNPISENIADDFFNPSKNKYSSKNNAGALYEALCATPNGFYYFDSDSDTVYFSPAENSSKQKKVLHLKNIQNIKTSSDGRFVALTYYSINDATVKVKCAIYDSKKKNIFYISEAGLKENSIIKNGDDYYLVSLKFHSQKKEIYIQKIEITKDKIKNVSFVATIPLLENNSANSFTDIQNGKFAFINKNRLTWTLKTADLNGNILAEYELPYEKMVIRNLSFCDDDKNELLFSFTTPNQMPKLGKLSLTENQFYFWNENLSGGVFYPVKNGEKIVYIGEFYTQNRIFSKNENEILYQTEVAKNVLENQNNQNEDFFATENNIAFDDEFNSQEKKYNPFKYVLKGSWIPVSQVNSYSYDYEHQNGNYSLPLGFTYLTSNPWNGDAFTLSAGYGIRTNSAGVNVTYSGGTSTSLFNYDINSTVEFDKLGFKQTHDILSVSSAFRVGTHSSLTLLAGSIFHYGRSNLTPQVDSTKYFNTVFDENSKNYLCTNQVAYFQFSNIHKTGPGKFEKLGFSLIGGVEYLYLEYSKVASNITYKIPDVEVDFSFSIPKLIPIKCKQGSTYNLPLTISAYLFDYPSSSYYYPLLNAFPTYKMASFGAEMVLFHKEIQEAALFIPNFLYINEFQLLLNYYGGFDYNGSSYYDAWKITKINKYFSMIKNGELVFQGYPYLEFILGMSLNFGGNVGGKFYIDMKYGIVPDKNNRYSSLFDIAMSYSL